MMGRVILLLTLHEFNVCERAQMNEAMIRRQAIGKANAVK